ncbi:MAG: hypothetical protein KZQ97_09200 [Candidatus Thiodiazotropha sp. (ex Dulcina madagascariensis)]|nr:hypothetical protein [Candidatus Thiodiazotropha sp. (ex Dulcina madagascariensis)]
MESTGTTHRSRSGLLATVPLGMLVAASCAPKSSDTDTANTEPLTSCWAHTWEKPNHWLETVDSGQVSQQMTEDFGAEPTNFHGVGLMGDPFVLYDQAIFRMWFSATAIDSNGNEAQGIAYSESSDGSIWSDPKDAVTLVKLQITPKDSPWSINALETPSVVKVDDVYYLYFSGRYQDQAFKIGVATSADGYTWAVHEQPVLEATLPWELVQQETNGKLFGGVLEPSVHYDRQTSIFYLWYSTFGVQENIFGGTIGFATSKDGMHWEKRKEPVFTPGANDSWDDALVGHVSVEKDPNGHYHMFYAGFPKGSSSPEGIGHARSADGVNWTRNPSNPIVRTNASWHTFLVGGPSSLILNGTMNLWYMGINSAEFSFVHFGRTTSSCTHEG